MSVTSHKAAWRNEATERWPPTDDNNCKIKKLTSTLCQLRKGIIQQLLHFIAQYTRDQEEDDVSKSKSAWLLLFREKKQNTLILK
ncbi:hypothetical protein KIN20_021184 [Parelaphostrongylus tenuis]|uniref:Uncharacterized protein n=1 Tax=Parelaphostrongylus tenuis TaxID=148309 RepID=A0AAD5N6U2_PARTN|nr:hypothetical protein KIN20_021184 [Parelaphostrongylus tenuis]